MSSKFNLPADLDIDASEDFTKDRIDQAFDYIVRRLATLDSFRPQFEEQIGLLRTVGLQRLNQALEPIYNRVFEIANLGVMFTATVSITQTLSVGNKTFILTEDERGRFAPASYLSAVPLSDTTKYMTGTLSSYNRDTGELVINMGVVDGTGTYGDWRISAAANPAGLSYTVGEIDAIIASLVGGAGTGYQTLGQIQASVAAMKTAIDIALSNKAPLSSPALTGAPTTTKPPVNDASTRIPTTSWVVDALSGAATSLSQQDARGSEKHPWELRIADDNLIYQYGSTGGVGVYSNKYGNIWSVATTSSIVTFGSRPKFGSATPWDSANFDPTAKANLATYNTYFGDQEIQKTVPNLRLHYPNVKWWDWQVIADGRLALKTSDNTTPMVVSANGAVSFSQVGDLLTAFNTKVTVGSSTRLLGITLGAPSSGNTAEGYVYSDGNSCNVRFRSGNATIGYKYAGLNDDGTFQTFSGDFYSVSNVRAAGRVIVGEGQTSSTIDMCDTDEGKRYVHNNSGYIGFLGNDAGWKLRVNDKGEVWSAQLGDLASYIEARGTAYRDSANTNTANNYFNKSTGTAQQVNNIPSFNAAAIDIVRGNVLRARWTVDTGGTTILQNGDNADNLFYVTNGGALWCKQLGDINSRIEQRAKDYAEDRSGYRVLKSGDTMTGNLELQYSQPMMWFHSPGVVRKRLWMTNDGYLRWRDQSENDDVFRVGPGGDMWCKQLGDINTRIEDRAYAWAATRQADIGQGNYDGNNRRFSINGILVLQGNTTATLDGNGDAYIAFPWAFSKCDSIVVSNGDGSAGNADYCFSVRNSSAAGFVVRVQRPGQAASGQAVRVNYIAMGY